MRIWTAIILSLSMCIVALVSRVESPGVDHVSTEPTEEVIVDVVTPTDAVEPTEEVSDPTEDQEPTTEAVEPPEEITQPTEECEEETIDPDEEPEQTDSTSTETEPTTQDGELISLGTFKLTAYCSCSKCCGKYAANRPVDENGNEIVYGAMGVPLKVGMSVAVDPTVIPYGSKVVINGHTYVAQDTGGSIKGNIIDVYFGSHAETYEFGVRYAEVFVYAEQN